MDATACWHHHGFKVRLGHHVPRGRHVGKTWRTARRAGDFRASRPDLLFEYAGTAEARGLQVIIAAAGGAAHLAGVTAAKTALPVLGVPMESQALRGMDSLLSTVQMPAGIPVATFAIGKPGAINAGALRDDDAREQGAEVPAGNSRISRQTDASGGRGG